ncbi:hypothetical protein G7061_07485 [Erysipelothrix sp. HDW6B]|uniref:hypothetical protein n=1 Tax=Erysipelothrix TaxID=1647 RepID=UPI001358862E|nr:MULTISPECIES: hypothetical protein [Erysipelothrix]QIK86460.1 hypothetical protein G7061_07485 [Erysipelothrix sp. HDW6B]
MFKKLTSLLFKEEEIVIEEEIEKHDKKEEESLVIPNLKPMVAKPKETKVEPASVVSTPAPTFKDSQKEEIHNSAESTQETRKSMMIDVDIDTHPEVKESKVKTEEKTSARREVKYQRKEIISPIFGGSDNGAEPLSNAKPHYQDAKSRAPKTSVISPMFGQIEVTEPVHEQISEDVMDMDVTELLAPERTEEEVQVSLYDYLEELDKHESK